MRKFNAKEKNEIIGLILKGKKTVKEIADKGDEYPSVSTIRRWKKYYLSQGDFTDNNNNDAIPSWSGYSFQGKIAVLCAVEKMNKLSEIDYQEWHLQLEKLQDFVFMHKKQVDSLWQVKAKLTANRHQSYKDAMDKLLKDRTSSGFSNAKCKLVTGVEVDNWDDKDNNYKDEIELYKYNDKIVTIEEVSNAIMNEIQILISKQNIKVDKESAYLQLCALLDDKVADFHRAGKKNNYLIAFEEIYQRIKDTWLFDERISKLKIKEKIYKNICKKIIDASKLYCEECEKNTNVACDENQCAICRNNELVEEADIENYMKSIRPEIENDLDYTISHSEEYTDSICYSLSTVPAIALKKKNDIISIACFEGKMHVIPTMIDLSRGSEKRLSKNDWLKNNIEDNVLLGNTQNQIFGTSLTKFTRVHLRNLIKDEQIINKKNIGIEYCIETRDNLKKSTQISKNIVILDREQIIAYFKEEESDEE